MLSVLAGALALSYGAPEEGSRRFEARAPSSAPPLSGFLPFPVYS